MAGDDQKSGEAVRTLRWLRWLALPLALCLIILGIKTIVSPPFEPSWFFRLRGGLEILLGLLMLLPFDSLARARPARWNKLFALLLLLSATFVFARVIGVLFEARAVEAAGGELGLPAWSGTLIFLVLAQLPVILFLRFPDQLD